MGEDDGQWASVGDTDGRFLLSVIRNLKGYYEIKKKTQFKFHFVSCQRNQVQSLVVGRLDNAIHRINRFPVDSVVCFINTYLLDSDLSGG